MFSDKSIISSLTDKSIVISGYYISEGCKFPATYEFYKITNGTFEILDKDFENNIQPCGYDLRVGIEGFSWKNKRRIDIQKDGKIVIHPSETIVIRTLEYIKLSEKIAGTIHSTATLSVENSLSQISTIVDPLYRGTLLISVSNNSGVKQELKYKDKFCTICFYSLSTEAEKNPARSDSREDLWRTLNLEQKNAQNNRIFIVIILYILYVLIIVLLLGIGSSWLNNAIDWLIFNINQFKASHYWNKFIFGVFLLPLVLGIYWINPLWFNKILNFIKKIQGEK